MAKRTAATRAALLLLSFAPFVAAAFSLVLPSHVGVAFSSNPPPLRRPLGASSSVGSGSSSRTTTDALSAPSSRLRRRPRRLRPWPSFRASFPQTPFPLSPSTETTTFLSSTSDAISDDAFAASSSSSTSTADGVVVIDGLLPPSEYADRSKLHSMLTKLRSLLPRLLVDPPRTTEEWAETHVDDYDDAAATGRKFALSVGPVVATVPVAGTGEKVMSGKKKGNVDKGSKMREEASASVADRGASSSSKEKKNKGATKAGAGAAATAAAAANMSAKAEKVESLSTSEAPILASGLDELSTLASVLSSAAIVGQRANDLLTAAVSRGAAEEGEGQTDVLSGLEVDCELLLLSSSIANAVVDRAAASTSADTNGGADGTVAVRVRWGVDLPPRPTLPSAISSTSSSSAPSSSASSTTPSPRIEGISELHLDPHRSYKVSSHRLLDVRIDGTTVPLSTVGESISRLRCTAERARDNLVPPWVKAFGIGDAVAASAVSIWDDIRDELLVQQRSTVDGGGGQETTATLRYVQGSDGDDDDDEAVLVDDCPDFRGAPLPGGVAWSEYAAFHRSAMRFVRRGLPLLAGTATSIGADDVTATTTLDDDEIEWFLHPDVLLVGIDGTTLLRGSDSIANLYRSLSTLRYSTNGDWKAMKLSLGEGWRNWTVVVQWKTTRPVVVEGEDAFVLESMDDGEGGYESVVQVQRIEQRRLVVAGTLVKDGEAVRTAVTALSRGAVPGGAPPGRILADLFRKRLGTTTAATKKRDRPQEAECPPPLNREAAASFYDVLRDLHRDAPLLLRSPSSSSPLSVPAASHLDERIVLRGLLGETLAKGKSSYTRAATTATAGLRAALRTGGVRPDDSTKGGTWRGQEGSSGPVEMQTEVTPRGTIRSTLELRLRVDAPQLRLPGVTMPSRPGDGAVTGSPSGAGGSASGGVPLKLELTSEYVVGVRGTIVEHRLIESRVNGRLTPGDVVSRWIAGVSPGLDGARQAEESAAAGALRIVAEAVAWAQRSV